MRVIIVDDEELMLMIFKEMLSIFPGIEILGMFQNARDAFAFLIENRVEMAFIDINMPEESGLELAKSISSHNIETDVVFITASKEHALEAFDVNAFDYVIKPIIQSRLEHTIKKAFDKQKIMEANNYNKINQNISIYCLGGLDIRNRNFEKIKWISNKCEEVFFYLLLKQGRAVSRHEMLEEIFCGMAPKNAETYLNTTIYQLRKSLEPHGLKAAVISYAEGYSLELKGVYIDSIDFERRVKQIGEINASNVIYSLETEKLYIGDLFNDKSYIWSLSERERIFEVYTNFAKKLGKWLFDNNDTSEALHILKKLSKINELDEETNCLLMLIYSANRDKLSLVKQYEKYVTALKSEIGIKPSRTIANIYAELRKGFE